LNTLILYVYYIRVLDGWVFGQTMILPVFDQTSDKLARVLINDLRYGHKCDMLTAMILIACGEDRTHGASKGKPASGAFWVNGRTTAQGLK
jgi:hypothetical protein